MLKKVDFYRIKQTKIHKNSFFGYNIHSAAPTKSAR